MYVFAPLRTPYRRCRASRTDPLISAGVGELLRADQARVHGVSARCTGGGNTRQRARQTTWPEEASRARASRVAASSRPARADMTGTSMRLEGKRHAEHVSVLGGVRVRQRLRDGSSPENPRTFRGSNQCSGVRRAGAPPTLGTGTGGHGLAVRVQALNVADERFKRADARGHHIRIRRWRRWQAEERTARVAQDRLGTGVTRQEWLDEGSGGGASVQYWLMRDESICVSAKPLSQRMGAGTFLP